jgi:hypothetical protein
MLEKVEIKLHLGGMVAFMKTIPCWILYSTMLKRDKGDGYYG